MGEQRFGGPPPEERVPPLTSSLEKIAVVMDGLIEAARRRNKSVVGIRAGDPYHAITGAPEQVAITFVLADAVGYKDGSIKDPSKKVWTVEAPILTMERRSLVEYELMADGVIHVHSRHQAIGLDDAAPAGYEDSYQEGERAEALRDKAEFLLDNPDALADMVRGISKSFHEKEKEKEGDKKAGFSVINPEEAAELQRLLSLPHVQKAIADFELSDS